MNYREEVKRTLNCDKEAIIQRFTNDPMLVNAALGLAAEAGEFADLIKKMLFHGVKLDREKALKELSDVRWYFELACDRLETTIEEIEKINVDKLRKRYPEGFNTEASEKRLDVQD